MISPFHFRFAKPKANLVTWVVILAGLLMAHGFIALALIVAARRVSPTEYGQYLASFGLVSLLVVLPNFGLEAWVLSQGLAFPVPLAQVWQGVMRWRLHLLVYWIVLIGGLSVFLPIDTFPRVVLLTAAVGVAGDSVAGLIYAYWRRLGHHRIVMGAQSVSALVLLAGALMLPLDTGGMILFSLSRMVVSVALVAVLMKWMGQWTPPVFWRPHFGALWKQQMPFLLSDMATAIYLRADLTLVALFLGAAGASAYGPALSIVNMSFLAPSAIYFLIVPLLADASGKHRSDFRRLSTLQLVAQGVTGIVLSLGIGVFAPPLIQWLFGGDYESSVVVLWLLSPIPFLKSINFAMGAILTADGHQSQRMRMQLLCALFNVVANLFVLQTWGTSGVAIVYSLSECLLLGGYSWLVLLKRPTTLTP